MRIVSGTTHAVVVRLDRALQASPTRERVDELEQQVQRMAAQLAALEERVADMRESSGSTLQRPPLSDPDLAEEVHREHRRMRQRMGLVTNYLSRLERVEDVLGVSAPGDRTGRLG